MKVNELFEEFLTYCKSYENVFGNLVIKNDDNMFIVLKPTNFNVDYIFYEIRIGSARESGVSNDADELLDLAISSVGKDMFNINKKKLY